MLRMNLPARFRVRRYFCRATRACTSLSQSSRGDGWGEGEIAGTGTIVRVAHITDHRDPAPDPSAPQTPLGTRETPTS